MNTRRRVKKILSEAGTHIDQSDQTIIPGKVPSQQALGIVRKSDRSSTYVSQGLTPQTLATIFKDADAGNVKRQAELFTEMEEKDLHIASVLQTRKIAVTGIPWTLEWDQDEEEQRDDVLQYCKDMIRGIVDFESNMFDLLDAIGKGYSITEIIWRMRDGDAVVEDLKWIHPKNAIFYDANGLADLNAPTYEYPKLLLSDTDFTGTAPDPYKIIYHRHKARSGYDTRAGILRVASWMYLFRNFTLKDWVTSSEVYGMPVRVGTYKSGASSNEINQLYSAVKNMAADMAVVISEETQLKFENAMSGTASSDIYAKLYDLGGREISKAVLGQTTSADSTSTTPGDVQGGVKDRAEVRQDLLASDIRQIQNTLHFQLLKPIVGFNFGWDAPVPHIRFKQRVREDLVAVSSVYKAAVDMGLPVAEDDAYTRLGIRKPEDGEKVIERPAAQNIFGGGAFSDRARTVAAHTAQKSATIQALVDKYDINQAQLDHLVAFAAEQSEKAIRKLTDPIRAMVKSGASLDSIKKELLNSYNHLPAQQLEKLVADTMLAARLFGVSRVQSEME